jgi:predicted nucleic acid-binding protein
MKQLFFDVAYLGKLHWTEPGSPEVNVLASTTDQLVCSQHGRAEFYSIGFRKVGEGLATPAILRSVFAQFNTDIASDTIALLPLTDTIIDRIEAVFATAPATTYLRAADALHLATAAENGFTEIHSNDKHLLAAAPLFGLLGVNVIPS